MSENNPCMLVNVCESENPANKLRLAGAVFGIRRTEAFGWHFHHSWASCLFQTVLRVWDCLFMEGSKILFRVGVTLVKKHSAAITQCQSFPEVMAVFRSIAASALNCHDFMDVSRSLRLLYRQYKPRLSVNQGVRHRNRWT